MNNSYYNVSHSRDYYKGKSVEFAGEWTSGVRYFNDEYLNSLVVYTEKDTTGNIIHSALLACKKTHIAAYNSSIPDSTNNQPHLIINDDLGTIGIEPNDYWIFVSGSLTGTPGTPGKSTEVVNTYLEAVALANEHNISKIVFVKEEKSIYIIANIGELKKIISTSDLLELAENKVDKELGKGLSTNDFSNTEKAKLKGIEDNAQRNIIEEVDLNGVKIDPIDKTISINTVGSINEQTGDITLRNNSETAWDVNLHIKDHEIQGKVVTPKSVGSETTPVYFNENGEITPINIDDEVIKNSNNLVTSGAIYRSLDLKQNQLIPGDNITIQNNVISAKSELNLDKYAKIKDVEEKLSTKQDTLIPDNGIKIEENRISVTAITESEEQPTTSIWVNPEENTEVVLSYNRSQIDALVDSKQNILTAGKGIQIVGSTISSTVDSNPFITVSELPSVGENGKIYLVPAESPGNNNVADEWIWNNGSWERLGSASVDLSNCPKLMDLTAIIANETDHITEERFNELKGLLSSPNTIFSFNRGGVYYYSTSVDLSKISDAPSGTNYESIDNIVIYFPKKQDTDGVYGYKVVLSSGFNNTSSDFWWSIYLTQNDFSVNTYNGVAAGLVPSNPDRFTKKYLNVNGSWTTVKSSELENDSRFISESALSKVAKTGEYSDLINKPLVKSSEEPINEEPLWINPDEDPEEVEVYNRSQVDALLNTKQNTLVPGSGIIIDGNVISSIGGSGGGSGGGSIDLSTYAKKADVETALAGKQNVISDLANIREGAEKGKTALQSFTETDPVYLKDKPSIALKSELLDDNSLVHKEGDEDINGNKWFEFIRTGNFGICQKDNNSHSVYFDYQYNENNYLPILRFSSEEDWATILDNIADPVDDFHAANKHYVDTKLATKQDILITPITYTELVALRDSSSLVAGMQYRITDYDFTTTEEDTDSAHQLFDIIVTADSESVLNENARAVHHQYETSGETLTGAIKLYKTDMNGYADEVDTGDYFLLVGTVEVDGVTYYRYDKYEADVNTGRYILLGSIDLDSLGVGLGNPLYPVGEGTYGEDGSYVSHSEDAIVAYENGTLSKDPLSARDIASWKLKYTLENSKHSSTDGKGTILWMKDEFRNECNYDFINALFKVYEITACVKSPSLVGTYAIKTGNSNIIFGTNSKLVSTFGAGNHDNIIKYDGLAKIVLGNSCYSNTFGNSCSSNTFGNDCYYNTFGNYCTSNTFGNDCYFNTFGDSCSSNTFGNNCYYNSFGNDCDSNTFGNSCNSNTFGNSCNSNTSGVGCDYNTFGNSCNSNTFGVGCDYNIFGNGCYYNTFGNGCYYNTFGNSCNSNTFGVGCYYNTFGNSCHDNTFGDSCQYNTFESECYYIIFASSSSATTKYNYYRRNHFGDGCQYILFKGAETASDSAQVQNYNFAQGVQGESNAYLTIDGVRSRAYETKVAKNSSGELKIYCEADLIQ